MNEKDLMIGDRVRVKLSQHDTTVTNIDSNSVYTEAAFPLRYDEIEPIPLNPEILEKNGLEKAKYYKSMYWSYNTDEHVKVDVSSDGDNFIEVRGEKGQYNGYCKFIHDFQHALRLCGIEKEIIL